METSKSSKGKPVQLTFLPVDSLANPTAMPGSEKASQMTATSGRNILGLYERLTQPMSLARTLLASSRWKMAKHLTGYSLIWRVKGTLSNRLLFQLAVSARGIEETEYGLLPTPCTVETDNRERVLDNAKQNLSLKSRKAGHNIQNNLTNYFNLESAKAKEAIRCRLSACVLTDTFCTSRIRRPVYWGFAPRAGLK